MYAAARRVLRAARVPMLCIWLAACVGHAFPWQDQDYYTVREGDTLYSIAFRNGLDYRDLARWNSIADPTLIFPGQRLQLYPPATTTVARPRPAQPAGTKPAPTARSTPTPPVAAVPRPPSNIVWRWPANGAIVARFGDQSSLGKGIDITGRVGDDVHAAAAGHVVYSGSGLIGYGKLVIVKHDENYLSAYGYNDTLFVEQGSQVSAGQRIATMGVGAGKRPLLHFEIRVDGKPVDPLRFLPAR